MVRTTAGGRHTSARSRGRAYPAITCTHLLGPLRKRSSQPIGDLHRGARPQVPSVNRGLRRSDAIAADNPAHEGSPPAVGRRYLQSSASERLMWARHGENASLVGGLRADGSVTVSSSAVMDPPAAPRPA